MSRTPRMTRSCDICGGPIQVRNSVGVCQRNPVCRREHQHRGYVANPRSRKEYALEWGRTNVIKSVLKGAKYRAKAVGVPFELEIEDLPPVPAVCPVFGIRLERGIGQPSPSSPELDRIIPELGYVKGNVQWLSRKANTMKQNASPEDLRTFAEWVLQSVPQEVVV